MLESSPSSSSRGLEKTARRKESERASEREGEVELSGGERPKAVAAAEAEEGEDEPAVGVCIADLFPPTHSSWRI